MMATALTDVRNECGDSIVNLVRSAPGKMISLADLLSQSSRLLPKSLSHCVIYQLIRDGELVGKMMFNLQGRRVYIIHLPW